MWLAQFKACIVSNVIHFIESRQQLLAVHARGVQRSVLYQPLSSEQLFYKIVSSLVYVLKVKRLKLFLMSSIFYTSFFAHTLFSSVELILYRIRYWLVGRDTSIT